MSKYLIISETCDDYFFPYVKSKDFNLLRFYKNRKYEGKIYKFLSRFGYDLLNNTNWINAEKSYDKVLFFDCSCIDNKFRQIKKEFRVRKILFIWNPMDYFLNKLNEQFQNYTIEDLKLVFDKIYYFDKSECEKYNVNYFPTVYSRNVPKKFKISNNREILFMGAEKNRGKIINEYNQIFRNNGLITDIYVSSDINDDENGIHYYKGRKNYSWYLEKLSKCGAILDIPQSGQNGFTLRVMESIFFQKKLITANRTIRNYAIYNKNNVFILGIDDICDLQKFMNCPYMKIDDAILDEYDFEKWIIKMMAKE